MKPLCEHCDATPGAWRPMNDKGDNILLCDRCWTLYQRDWPEANNETTAA